MPEYIQTSDGKHAKKHIFLLSYAKHHTPVFSYDKAASWLLNETNKILVL